MTRAHYHLNLNLDDPNEREAWHILQSKRHGSRTTFLVEAILQQGRQKQAEERLRAVIRAELGDAIGLPPTYCHGFLWVVSHG